MTPLIARKCSYNPDYDSDSDSNSVASENPPLVGALLSSDQVTWTTRNEEACVKWIANGENVRLKPAFFCRVSLTNPLFLFYVLPSVFKTIFTGSQFFYMFSQHIFHPSRRMPRHIFLSPSAVNLNSPSRKESETIEKMAINRPLTPAFFTLNKKLTAFS